MVELLGEFLNKQSRPIPQLHENQQMDKHPLACMSPRASLVYVAKNKKVDHLI